MKSNDREALADLLRREIEDASRITGLGVSSIGRIIANDPALHADLAKRGRIPRLASLHAWHSAVSDMIAFSATA